MQNNKSFDFVGKFKIFISISLAIILVGVVINIFFGTKLDINFKGGSKVTYSYEGNIDFNKAASIFKSATGFEASSSESQDYTTGTKSIVITVAGETSVTTDDVNKATEALNKEFKDAEIKMTGVNSVAKLIGAEFFKKSIYSLLIASILVVIYVGFRFRKIGGTSAAVTALIALIHDVIIVYFVDVILRIPLDDNFIAVELTILGYSLNDTIVIYDRIRENNNIYGKSMSHKDLVNLSITQSFRRSLITSFATFIAISTITVVAAFASLDTILSFSIPMSVGVIAGSFSSICIAGPLYVMWLNYKDKHTKNKQAGKPDYANKKKAKA